MKKRGNSHKLQGSTGYEEKFTMRVVQCKNRLPRESGYHYSFQISFGNISILPALTLKLALF